MKRTVFRITWLALAAFFVGSGFNLIAESPAAAAVLGAAAVGLFAVVLIPGAVAGRYVVSHSKRAAGEIEANPEALRELTAPAEELTR